MFNCCCCCCCVRAQNQRHDRVRDVPPRRSSGARHAHSSCGSAPVTASVCLSTKNTKISARRASRCVPLAPNPGSSPVYPDQHPGPTRSAARSNPISSPVQLHQQPDPTPSAVRPNQISSPVQPHQQPGPAAEETKTFVREESSRGRSKNVKRVSESEAVKQATSIGPQRHKT